MKKREKRGFRDLRVEKNAAQLCKITINRAKKKRGCKPRLLFFIQFFRYLLYLLFFYPSF